MLMSAYLHLAKMGAPVKTQGAPLNVNVRRAGSLKPVTKVCRRVLKDILNQISPKKTSRLSSLELARRFVMEIESV